MNEYVEDIHIDIIETENKKLKNKLAQIQAIIDDVRDHDENPLDSCRIIDDVLNA